MPTTNLEEPRTLDALMALYGAQREILKTLSERSFSTALQTLTLNVAVVAGLIGSKVNLSANGKWVATWMLLIFHILVVSYLISKSRAHHREKRKLDAVQQAIAATGGVEAHFSSKNGPSYVRSFFGGSGIFTSAVALACACSIWAVHTRLLA